MPKGSGARNSRLGRAIETDVAFIEEASRRDEPNTISTVSNKTVSTDSSKPSSTDEGERNKVADAEDTLVNLTIKVPLTYRRHWQIEAKRLDRSVTSVIMDALQEKLGLPSR